MMVVEQLLQFDRELLLLFNGFNHPFWDELMFLISDKWIWIPFYLSLIYVLIRIYKKDSWYVILGIILVVAISDQISSGLIKPHFARFRPTHEPTLVGQLHLIHQYTGGLYGFVSSHAANSFGLALFTSLLIKDRKYTLLIFSWAALVSYSRIYLGVHYPLDIVGGGLVGLTVGSGIYMLLKKMKSPTLEHHSSNEPLINSTIILFFLTVIGIAVYGFTQIT